MIVDDLKNIDNYKSLIPENVLIQLKNISSDIKCGKYDLSNDNYINIDEYSPKPVEICRFEAHKKYIDIQIMLDGEEYIDITDINKLEISESYDNTRDIMFFKPKNEFDRIHLTPLKFALIYPYEAHRPQVKTNCDKVKKAVVKVFIR